MERQKRSRRRRRRMLRKIGRIIKLFLLCILIMAAGRLISKKKDKDSNVVNQQTDIICQTQEAQTVARSSFDEAAYEELLNNETDYPENMREALRKNQELFEFVKNYNTTVHGVNGGITEEEKKQPFPLFLQWDSRWGYASYGDDNIGLSGCAPTSLSMVIFSLTRDEKATPDAIADYGMRGSYYVYGTGTKWALLTDAAEEYGITVRELSLDENVMKNHLDRGGMIICSMRAGDFTDNGHFIVLYGYDDTGFLVNDPNSRIRSRQSWPYEKLSGQIKNLWGYQKE